jgi:hypothetical protein
MPDMTAVKETIHLVKMIHTLLQALPPSVPKVTTGDKIWDVMHSAESESAFQTFNQRFDALFAEDCRDAKGRLHYIRQGKSGMGLVCSYLRKLDWSQDFPLDLVGIKLRRLITELNHIMYVSHIFIITRWTDTNSGGNIDELKSTRQTNLASKLRDADNAQQPELSFQRKAIITLQAAQGPPPPEISRSSARSDSEPREPMEASSPESVLPSATPKAPEKRTTVVDVDGDDDDVAQPKPRMSHCLFFEQSCLITSYSQEARQAWKCGQWRWRQWRQRRRRCGSSQTSFVLLNSLLSHLIACYSQKKAYNAWKSQR